nr:MAG TPA: hypothetical protein [Caudoviricetes sp.]
MVIFLYFKMIESIVFIWIIKNYIYNFYLIKLYIALRTLLESSTIVISIISFLYDIS